MINEYDKILYDKYDNEDTLFSISNTDMNTHITKVPMYNLDFIKVGQEYPPKSQKERISNAVENEKLFNGDLVNVLTIIQSKILAHLRNTALSGGTNYYNNPSVENYFELLTNTKSDMLVANNISLTSYSNINNDFMNEYSRYIKKSALIQDIGKHISIFGEAVVVNDKDSKGAYVNRLAKPYNWIPILNPYSKELMYHVIVTPHVIDNEKYLTFDVHGVGIINRIVYKYDGEKLASVINNSTIKTGLNDFAVKVISREKEDGIFGRSDYTVIKNRVAQICVDNTLLDFICACYVTPSFQGDSTSLQTGANGVKEFILGRFHATGLSTKIEQIKIENYCDELRKNKKLNLNALGRLTGMESIFRDKENVGALNNFSALRLSKESDVSNVKKIKNAIEISLYDIIRDSAIMVGESLDVNDIAMDWTVSISLDEREKAEIEQIRTQKPTSSVISSIERLDNVSTENALKEYEMILKENKENGGNTNEFK